MTKLRDYQLKAVESTRERFKAGDRAVVLQMPTGAGKTFTACHMIKLALERGRRVLVVVHRRVLVDQFSESLSVWDIEHGYIAAGYPKTEDDVRVGMIQTIARRPDSVRDVDLIVVDECHHATAAQYRKLIDMCPDAKVLGLTATPARTDGRGLKEMFDSLVIGPTMKQLITLDALAPCVVYASTDRISTAGIKTVGGDYHQGELETACNKSEITGDVIEHYRKHAAGKLFCIFTVSVKHAHAAAEQFTDAGIPCVAIDGKMQACEIEQALDKLRSGAVVGISSCNMISEGFDLPTVEAAIMLRPTKSLIVWLQSVGRALRYLPGKRAVIIDHTNNCLSHGLPQMHRDWTLEGRTKKKADTVVMRQCPECQAAIEGAPSVCPECGYEFGGEDGDRATGPVYRDGVLTEITEDDVERERWKNMPYPEAIRLVRSVEDLLKMQKARGYKQGWITFQAKEKFGMERHQTLRALGYSEQYIWQRGRHAK